MDEYQIRLTAFEWLRQQTLLHGDTLARSDLERGFPFQGEYVTLIGPSGIWKPRQISSVPISITTTFGNPYKDGFSDSGLLVYRYRGTDPGHRDNQGLQAALKSRTPLIYFHGIVPGRYVAVWPIFILEANPQKLNCVAAVDPAYALNGKLSSPNDVYADSNDESTLSIRRYVMSVTRTRLHQSAFREQIIMAYDEHCALCALRHRELLDAAHIIPDTRPKGDPVVPNGLSLCKIHHAAYDQNILGVTPDFEIRLRTDILSEIDGPMLRYGLQELHNKKIYLPHRKRDWPDRERLEIRFEEFENAG